MAAGGVPDVPGAHCQIWQAAGAHGCRRSRWPVRGVLCLPGTLLHFAVEAVVDGLSDSLHVVLTCACLYLSGPLNSKRSSQMVMGAPATPLS